MAEKENNIGLFDWERALGLEVSGTDLDVAEKLSSVSAKHRDLLFNILGYRVLSGSKEVSTLMRMINTGGY